MESYQERVIDEKLDLAIKIRKLDEFMKLDKFLNLDLEEKQRLWKQLETMRTYLSILNERITAFKGEQQ